MRTARTAFVSALASLVWTTVLTTMSVGSAAAANAYCGAMSGSYDPQQPPRYQHVVVLMEENVGYTQFVGSSQLPFLHQLAQDCGSETNFHAATHPSQPNYMAATSGVATKVGEHTANDNVFHQVQATGRAWKLYAESMPRPCTGGKTGTYQPGHTPAVWYTDLRSPTNTCAQDQVPLSPALDDAIADDALPAYSWITPNQCDDFHWLTRCGFPRSQRIAHGDAWLADLLPRLVRMPSYQAGSTLILLTFDEGGGGTKGVDCTDPAYYRSHPDCHIPALAVSPYVVPGTTDGSDQNLYSLLGTTEDVLGLPRLGRAAGQPSMRAGLGF
jgi:phospholipase C